MKKQTIALFILIFTAAGLTAETGYKGINWGSAEFIITYYEGEEINPVPNKDNYYPMLYKKTLLGEETNLFYLMQSEYGLLGVFYVTPETNNEKLKFNLRNKEKIYEYPFLRDAENQLWKKAEEEFKEAIDYPIVEYSIGFYMWQFAGAYEFEYKVQQFPTEGLEGIISVYDYNDDTRLYIFENIIPEKTIVVYFPYEQDY